jgi:predicted DNA-binding protein with PD1-like motif
MELVGNGTALFVRVDPGEQLVASLLKASTDLGVRAAAIVSGVGMLSSVKLGFFEEELDDYVARGLPGIFDVSVITGNVVARDDKLVAHIHAVMNDPSHVTYSGHVIEAICHITMELFLSTSRLELERVKLPNCAATRIVARGKSTT